MKATHNLHRPTPDLRIEGSDFPAAEAASFTSLPTPVVPASAELLSLGGKEPAAARKAAPTGTSGARKIGFSSLMMNKVAPPAPVATAPAIPPPAPIAELPKQAAPTPEAVVALSQPVVAPLEPVVAPPEPVVAPMVTMSSPPEVVITAESAAPPPAVASSPPGFGPDEQLFWSKSPSRAPASLPPTVPPPRPRPRVRMAAAKVLFFVLFGAVALLFGYALKQRLAEAGPLSSHVEELRR